MGFWRLVPEELFQRVLQKSEGAGVRFACIDTYRVFLDKSKTKWDNTLQRDVALRPDPLYWAGAPICTASVNVSCYCVTAGKLPWAEGSYLA